MTIPTFTTCPDCGEIAGIRDRFVLASTDGPVEHLRMICPHRHHFMLPVACLDRVCTPSPPAAVPPPVVGNAC
jgi:hypothetical protein